MVNQYDFVAKKLNKTTVFGYSASDFLRDLRSEGISINQAWEAVQANATHKLLFALLLNANVEIPVGSSRFLGEHELWG